MKVNSLNAVRPKILIVLTAIPKPDAAAGDLRFFAMLQILAKNNTIDLYATQEDTNSPEIAHYMRNLQEIDVNVLTRGRLGLEQAVLRRAYDIILFEFWQSAEQFMDTMRRQQPRAKVVVDSVDIHFAREEAGLAFGLSEASVVRQNKQREIKTYQQADLVVVVTQEDHEALVAEKVTTALMQVPMIVPIRARETKQRALELLFIGGFRHLPNKDGLLWFISECWPAIRARVPEANLTVVGSNAPPEINDLNGRVGVTVAGFVPETAPYLDKAYLSIAPLRFGAGMKGKVTEAMAAGLPVVTTTFGVQGLNAVSGKHLLVSDDAALFSEHVVSLLSNPKQSEEMGLAGQNHIRQICSAEVVERLLDDMVSALMPNPASKRSPFSPLISLGYRGISLAQFLRSLLRKVLRKVYRRTQVSREIA